MAKRLLRSRERLSLKFGQASFELLGDFLINFNQKNKENLDSLSKCCGSFKLKPLLDCIFLICQELKLDPAVGYHATELLQRFMVKHLSDLLVTPETSAAAASEPRNLEDSIFDQLKEKFPLIVFSCVQLANKMSLNHHMIDTGTAVSFLHLLGLSVSKKTILESELMVFKGLEFKLIYPNPLTSVETLLEVLGHNDPSVPVKRLYHLCRHVLQFITLQKAAIYDSLLKVTTQRASPSKEQREKFVTVTEDCMLLGVGVIAVAVFILYIRKWEQVIGELSHITGISVKSISDFAHVTLAHIVGFLCPAE
ncbi:cyclin N-terminal domain-containing protein 1 isoform X1 [Oryzias latipes]|uniref:Cyclin N-terminal domain containing 1 n=1 Tax=Oryzias latipes TaxID=8090 RepID=H2M6Z8_ORYLA|nr:cyclin N-terminal domain-containing protein 1 isoform X1 [Oryzias latipes]